ncbi:MAG: hypothetical protein HZC41_25260 [Chloroflexi bacterium]|nr:hypothetical protein [Chloroflexota bacterium]
MVTLRLWRALNRPPSTHPVFQRTVVLPVYSETHYLSWANVIISLVIGLSRYAPTLLFLLMPLILLVLGLTYGLDCALRVGSAITREHERDTYSLLSLTPSGPFSAMWALCASALYRNHDFMRLRDIVRVSISSGVVGAVVVAGLLLVFTSNVFTRFPQPATLTFAHLLNFLVILGAVYVEYVQSLALGVLVGMAVATYTASRLDASLWAFGLYLLLQAAVYVLTLLVGFTLLPLLYDRLHLTGDYALTSLSLLRLGIFGAMRELIVTALWRSLLQRLNVTPMELDFMPR